MQINALFVVGNVLMIEKIF